MKKTQIRQKILLKRSTAHSDRVCSALNQHLYKYLLTQSCHCIGFYFPIRNEISLLNTIALLEKDFEFALPKIVDGQMEFYRWVSCEAITRDELGVPAPTSMDVVVPELILIPCLAMDQRGYRLGYGQGWYDRYLNRYPTIKTIGIVANQFLFKQLPTESQDHPLRAAISETGMVLFNERRIDAS